MNKIFFGTVEQDEMNRPSALPDDTVVAMAYVPIQFYESLFEIEDGFSRGTVFPELYKPFTGCDGEW